MYIKLCNADCIEYLSTIESYSVDLVLTDPPYNLGKFMQDRQTNLNKMRENFFVGSNWDNMEYNDWVKHMEEFFDQLARIVKKDGSLVIFMSIIRVETILNIAQQKGFYYKTTGIWHKTNPMPRNMNLHFVNSTEAWIYFTYKKRTGVFNNNNIIIHDFIEMPSTGMGEKKHGKHPTQKPVQLMQHFINLLSHEGQTVLDPFMGSGSTGVASINLKRNFIGIEIDKKYYDIAYKRTNELIQGVGKYEIYYD